jgi:hypothetical protein
MMWSDEFTFTTVTDLLLPTAVKAVIVHAAATDEWRLAEAECENVEQILGLHDQQLGALPKHLIDAAKQQLMRALAKGSFPCLGYDC